MKKFDRVKAVVSLDAIAHNFEEMKKNIAEETKIVAVIKADGYGHGAEAIARLIEDYEYIWGFATATPEEALQLRDAGIDKPILILGIVFEEYYKELIAHEVRMTVCEYEMAAALSEEAVRQGKQVHIHIGLDTGMSRIGFADVPESVVPGCRKVQWFLEGGIRAAKPVILDADGLNLLAQHPEWKQYLTSHVVMTPHMGEMGLTGKKVSELQKDRIAAARMHLQRPVRYAC